MAAGTEKEKTALLCILGARESLEEELIAKKVELEGHADHLGQKARLCKLYGLHAQGVKLFGVHHIDWASGTIYMKEKVKAPRQIPRQRETQMALIRESPPGPRRRKWYAPLTVKREGQ